MKKALLMIMTLSLMLLVISGSFASAEKFTLSVGDSVTFEGRRIGLDDVTGETPIINGKQPNEDNEIIVDGLQISILDSVCPDCIDCEDMCIFSINVIEEESNATVRESNETSVISELSPVRQNVFLVLSPVKQLAKPNEWVEYSLVIRDTHPMPDCTAPEGADCMIQLPQYTYEIFAEAEVGTVVELNQKEVSVGAGEKVEVKFSVRSKNKGVNSFAITARSLSGDAKGRVRGVLVISEESNPPQPPVQGTSFFFGNGFALNNEETQGKLVELRILKKEDILTGKISIGKNNYRIKGIYSDGQTNFEILKIESGVSVGKFSGKADKFGTFLLLRGNLEIDNKILRLTATSTNRLAFREVEFEEDRTEKIEEARLQEVIELKKKARAGKELEIGEETYIRPIKISKEKFLKIIPNPWGKKILVIEIIKGDKVIREEIQAREEKKFQEYKIKVGNLEDEENIELEIQEVEEE
tara:strand:- start:302 stop:1714 length:1413 start_codon:yes stop_codon:yes gene_type:complete